MTEPTKKGRRKSAHKLSQASKTASVAEEQIKAAFDFWIETMQKSRPVLDDKRRQCIGAAIHDYGLEQVLHAIEGCTYSDFHMGRNRANKKYDDVSLILRDAEHVERFLELYDNRSKGSDW